MKKPIEVAHAELAALTKWLQERYDDPSDATPLLAAALGGMEHDTGRLKALFRMAEEVHADRKAFERERHEGMS